MQAAGVGITAIGVAALVLKKGAEATFDPLGYIMLLFAVVSYGLYSIFAQKTVQYTDIEKTYGMITLGAIVFTALALAENGIKGTIGQWIALPFMSPSFLIAVLYLRCV